MKLIVSKRIAEFVAPRLAEYDDVALIVADENGDMDGDPSDADALLRWWTPAPTLQHLLDAAPNVRWIHTPSAGVDSVVLPVMLERNITLTNSAGIHAVPIAEFVLMMMLNHVKRADQLYAAAKQQEWFRDETPLQELYGKTVLIVGLGQIGQAVAKRAAAFEMRVLGSRRHPQPMDGVAQVVGDNRWRDLLPEADYVIVAAPLTNDTRGMIDADAFGRMKPSAYLINIARGQIVDTDALLYALEHGQIAGAGLDALPEEPLPASHPLWRAPNAWITPHISWSSPLMRDRSLDLFFDNLRRYRAGEPLHNVVDYSAGY